MKSIAVLIVLILGIAPCWAQENPSVDDIISQMKTQLDLQQEQVTNITPIIEKYATAFADLQKSVKDGTINASSVDSQFKGLEDQETQEISQYLKPYQLSEWRTLQSQLYQQGSGGDDSSGSDQYSNLPNNPSQTAN